MNDRRLLLLDPADNVMVATQTIASGDLLQIGGVRCVVTQELPLGHKIAARAICAGEKILKYRSPIGSAIRDIAIGEHVHLHNMKSDYLPTYTLEAGRTFNASHANH